jgi:hypothetical protein
VCDASWLVREGVIEGGGGKRVGSSALVLRSAALVLPASLLLLLASLLLLLLPAQPTNRGCTPEAWVCVCVCVCVCMCVCMCVCL